MAIKLDFKQSTWEKAKPKELKKESLSAALKDVERSMGDDKKLAACIAALRQAAAAASDLMDGECSAKKNKELNAALRKFVSDSQSEIEKLQEKLDAAGEEDEDEDGDLNKLLNRDKFKIFLKKAKSASSADRGAGFCFCFHKVDGEKCELVLMPPNKINSKYAKLRSRMPKEDNDYKKRNILKGLAYRDEKFLVLECMPGEEPPEVPGMDKKIRRWAKSHKSDIAPMKKVRISIPGMAAIEVDVPEEDEAVEEEGTENMATSTAVPPKAPPQPNTATAGVSPTASPPPNGTTTDVPPKAPPQPDAAKAEDRRKEFREARQAWQAAKEKAIQDLERVKDHIRDYYIDDPELFKVATSKLKQLDEIMDNLGDDLRNILDQYVSTPKTRSDQLHQLANEASTTVERFLKYVNSDRLLNAVDNEQEMGLADLKVREPLEQALRKLVKTLG